MNIRNISHFEGLDTSSGRGKASLFTLLEAKNIRTHNGEAVKRKGQLYIYDEEHELDGEINSIYQYSRDALDTSETPPVETVYREYVVSITHDDGTIDYYGWDGEAASTIDRINETSEEVRIEMTSDDMWLAQYNGWAWVTNGLDAMYKYDGIDFLKAGIAAPTQAPTFARTANPLTPQFNSPFFRKYKYRWIRIVRDADGIYEYTASPFSPESVSPDFQGKTMTVTCQNSTDEQVNYIELYGTLGGEDATGQDLDGGTWYRIDAAQGAGNVNYSGMDNDLAPSHTDIYPDGYLDGVTFEADISELWDSSFDQPYAIYHPELDTANTWRNPPERLKYITYYKDRLYAVSAADRSRPLYSDLAEPESWHYDNWLEVRVDGGGFVTGFVAHGNSLYIFKDREVWALTGDPDASPTLQALSGGERTGSQTEIGIGCTAPRSIATYGEDLILFYSSLYGVYKIQNGQILPVSQGQDILGLSDDTSGVVWVDNKGEVFYTLSPPSGDAWVLHIGKGFWWNDENINVACFCVDRDGRILGGSGGFVNRYYHPDQTDDNGVLYFGVLKTAWLDLRRANEDAILRKLQVQKKDLHQGCFVIAENESGDEYASNIESDTRFFGIDNVSGRLFSYTFTWLEGIIESVTSHYRRRRGH